MIPSSLICHRCSVVMFCLFGVNCYDVKPNLGLKKIKKKFKNLFAFSLFFASNSSCLCSDEVTLLCHLNFDLGTLVFDLFNLKITFCSFLSRLSILISPFYLHSFYVAFSCFHFNHGLNVKSRIPSICGSIHMSIFAVIFFSYFLFFCVLLDRPKWKTRISSRNHRRNTIVFCLVMPSRFMMTLPLLHAFHHSDSGYIYNLFFNIFRSWWYPLSF